MKVKPAERRSPVAEGHIKWFNEKKGYGFIEVAGEEDIFFHQSGIVDHGFFGIQKLDRVSYEVEDSPRGKKAIRIKKL
jgi:CspA family cold shock protein